MRKTSVFDCLLVLFQCFYLIVAKKKNFKEVKLKFVHKQVIFSFWQIPIVRLYKLYGDYIY